MKIPAIFTRFIVVFIIFYGFNDYVKSQEGYPFMSNFPFVENIDYENFDLIQDNHNNILFANRKGILIFNSRTWDLLPMSFYPLKLEKSLAGDGIYVGCQNGFGILQTNETGKYEYQPLNNIDSTGEISSIGVTGEKTFFVNQYRIFHTLNNDNSTGKLWEFAFEYPVTGSFVHDDKFFFSVNKRGLFKAVRDTFELVTSNNFVKELQIVFVAEIDASNTLIGTDRNRIYRFDGNSFIPMDLVDNKYLNERIITDGIYLGDKTIAIATILGGVLICNYENGKTHHIINYNSGLPDDEIFCIGTDNLNGLWLSHSFGVTRIDLKINIRNFTYFPGLKGNLTKSVDFNGKLYVGTSDGIYILEEKKNFIEKVILEETISVIPPVIREIAEPEPEPVSEPPSPEIITRTPRINLRIFSRLRKKATQKEDQDSDKKEAKEDKIPDLIRYEIVEEEQRDTIISERKEYSLQSISHSFISVSGIKGRCTDLISINGHLLAGTNSGLYEIKGNKSIPVLPNRYIQFVSYDTDKSVLLVGTSDSFFVLSFSENRWVIIREMDALGYSIYSACMTIPNTLWFGSDNSVYKLNIDNDFFIEEVSRINITTMFSEKVNVKKIDNELYFFLLSGIYKFEYDTIQPIKLFNHLLTLPTYYNANDQVIIYRSGEKWGAINKNLKIPEEYFNIFSSIQDISVSRDGSTWIISDNKIYKISEYEYVTDHDNFSVYFAGLKGREDELYPINKPDIHYSRSSLKIDFSAPFYIAPGKTEFRYYIKGINTEWSEWTSASSIEYPLLPPGKYSIHIQARNIFGAISEETILDIHIEPPFYKTKLFYSFIFISIIGLFLILLRIKEKRHLYVQRILEQKVRVRTAEIERQKNELAEQKKEITDSIYYAQRIQSAVLPSTSMLKTHLSEHFVLFLPRDIVSGDFYWSTVKENKVVIVAADCTGHGVPGAFMSMLGVSFLNEIVNKLPLTTAGEILDALRLNVKNTLSQSGEIVQRDGMDIALCIIDKKKMKLQYAGANNPIYMIRNNQLSQIKADKMPIGIYEKNYNFATQEIDLKKGDTFYLFSDGFVDQFGGIGGKKYLSNTFRNLLLNIYDQSMNQQKDLLSAEFKNWKGNHYQVDDVLIIGFRI